MENISNFTIAPFQHLACKSHLFNSSRNNIWINIYYYTLKKYSCLLHNLKKQSLRAHSTKWNNITNLDNIPLPVIIIEFIFNIHSLCSGNDDNCIGGDWNDYLVILLTPTVITSCLAYIVAIYLFPKLP